MRRYTQFKDTRGRGDGPGLAFNERFDLRTFLLAEHFLTPVSQRRLGDKAVAELIDKQYSFATAAEDKPKRRRRTI